MIVTCPNCKTRYLVDEAVLGEAAERRVRCANCGNLWNHPTKPEAVLATLAGPTADGAPATTSPADRPFAGPDGPGRRAEPMIESRPHPAGPTALGRPSVTVEPPAADTNRVPRPSSRGGRGGWAVVLGLIVVVAGLALVAYVGRDTIVALWPAAAPVYRALQLTGQTGAGLEVTATPKRTGESLVIDGSIVNGAAQPQRVPRLRVTLRDSSKSNLETKLIDPPVDRLAPGASARFNTTFDHPNSTATEVAVTFAPD
jgi:predicted Zn finger-like uncharacterized protein